MRVNLKSVLWIVKYSPIITNIAVMVGLIFTFTNYKLINHLSPNFSCALFTAVGWWVFSKHYRFCFFHRLLIINLAFISLLVYLQINWLVFDNAVYVRMMLLSTIATLLLYYAVTSLIFKNKNT